MKLPSFSLPGTGDKNYTNKDFESGNYILYIYPKDMTSGCTLEAQDFRDMKDEFQKLGFEIFGVSKDPIKSHDKFCEKESLNFVLLADEETSLIQDLDAWKEKNMYGKKYFGAERSTFLIVDGEIKKEWRKVKAKGHAEEVLNYIKTTQ